MSKRTYILAVTGLVYSVAACGSYGTSVEFRKAAARVASVSLTIPQALTAGQTARAVATPKDATGAPLSGRPIAWFTSSPAIASVTDSGVISAVAPGSAIVSAVSEGVSGQATVAVMPPNPIAIATITVAVSPSSVLVGQTARATATLMDSSGKPIVGRPIAWQSSNLSVATVAPTGDVTAVAPGTAMIAASSEGKAASTALSVSAPAPIPVASVLVSPATANVQVGATVQLSAATRDAAGSPLSGRLVTWSSSNTTVATVSASGLVSGLVAGPATITATSEGVGGTAALSVTATPPVPVASVLVSPAPASVQVGATVQLSAATRDAAGSPLTGRLVTWSSNNTTVATVSASGLVSGLVAGPATITATSEGISGTTALSVTAASPVPVGAPEPVAGDVILWQDNFDKATLAELVAPYARRGAMLLVTDGHSGQAIRFPYSASSYDDLIEKTFPPTTDIYFRYWYRLSPGADPTCGGRGSSGFKWFMPWRAVAQRYTMGVTNLSGGPVGFQNTGLEFATHDNTSTRMPNPFMQNINKSKTFKTTADGAWHEYTLHVVTAPQGYEQIWIDGVKVLDSQQGQPGVPVGYDHSPEGISLIQFPGAMVAWYAGCEFTLDVDDFAIWHK